MVSVIDLFTSHYRFFFNTFIFRKLTYVGPLLSAILSPSAVFTSARGHGWYFHLPQRTAVFLYTKILNILCLIDYWLVDELNLKHILKITDCLNLAVSMICISFRLFLWKRGRLCPELQRMDCTQLLHCICKVPAAGVRLEVGQGLENNTLGTREGCDQQVEKMGSCHWRESERFYPVSTRHAT